MKISRFFLAGAFFCLTLSIHNPAFAASILEVNAASNIFAAGHSVPTAPGGGGGGMLPPEFNFAVASNQILTFSSVTGLVSYNHGGNYWGPDGPILNWGTNLNSYDGISGIILDNSINFLTGVFLDDTEPVNPAPSSLDFSPTRLTTSFNELYPKLNQLFFIGDGLTGTGTGSIQQFHVPENSTRLFLGFADGYDFTGDHGYYADNIGSLTATFSIESASVPEPASILLLLSGIVGLMNFKIERN